MKIAPNLLTVALALLALVTVGAAPGRPVAVATTLPVDTPEVKQVRDQLLDWDKNAWKMSLAEIRNTFQTENEREATYVDWVADESWESVKTERVVREKWGAAGDALFSHLLETSTLEDDQFADIRVNGDHAVVTWTFKGATPASMIQVDGHWLIDGHAIFNENLKNDPAMESDKRSTGKLMKQARDDIAHGKFDDAESFVADFLKKLETPDAN